MNGPARDRPVVGVLACGKRRANATTYSRVNDLVVECLSRHAQVAVVLIPTTAAESTCAVLPAVDGLVLPGSGSYLHPSSYDPTVAAQEDREYDHARDAVSSALLAAAEESPDLPILGSCRGMQEIAVHYGAHLRDTGAGGIHRLHPGPDHTDRWAPAHPITIATSGLLAALTADRQAAAVMVNSQHSQVVADLPGRVRVEAVAPDGVVEAIGVDWPARFVLGIQWHFEHHTETSDLDPTVLAAFGRRCEARRKARRNPTC